MGTLPYPGFALQDTGFALQAAPFESGKGCTFP